MSEKIYRELARRLNAIPPGLPASESGIELEMLAKLYSPEEAVLASIMQATPETADALATRAGADPAAVRKALDAMAEKGLIRRVKGDGEPAFGMPSNITMPPGIVLAVRQGDAEAPALYEAYYQEMRGRNVPHTPSHLRVIPVQESVTARTEIHPHEQAVDLIKGAKSWAVRDCNCRLGARVVGRNCPHPLEVCMAFSQKEGALEQSPPRWGRAIGVEEALRILRQAEEAGLVHTTSNIEGEITFMCNCCACACPSLRAYAKYAVPTGVAHSDFWCVVAADRCIGCEECLARCQFGALSVADGGCLVNHEQCLGCGLCVTVCSTEALRLERRPVGETPPMPKSFDEWAAAQAAVRAASPTAT